MNKLVIAVAMCLVIASSSAAFGQSGRVGWDGTWVGGWDRAAGVQLIFAGDTLIGFYFRDDYKDITRSAASPDRAGVTFAWAKGTATLTRTPNGAQLVVREPGRPEITIPLKRE